MGLPAWIAKAVGWLVSHPEVVKAAADAVKGKRESKESA